MKKSLSSIVELCQIELLQACLSRAISNRIAKTPSSEETGAEINEWIAISTIIQGVGYRRFVCPVIISIGL